MTKRGVWRPARRLFMEVHRAPAEARASENALSSTCSSPARRSFAYRDRPRGDGMTDPARAWTRAQGPRIEAGREPRLVGGSTRLRNVRPFRFGVGRVIVDGWGKRGSSTEDRGNTVEHGYVCLVPAPSEAHTAISGRSAR